MQNAKLLKKILRSEKSGRVARRLQMLIVFLMVGSTFTAVGVMTNWDRRTVSLWYGRYRECRKSYSGICEALSDRPRTGRRPKIRREHLEGARLWCEGRAFTPVELSDKLVELSGVSLSMGQVRRYARRWGYSRKKAQPVSAGRATMSAVYSWRHRLLALVSKYQKLGYAIVTQDESHFKDATRTSKHWAKRCLRVLLPWSGGRHRFSMLCSATLDGRTFFNHADVINTHSFLEHIEKVYQEVGKMVLVLDKAPWHMSADAMAYFGDRDIILAWYPAGHPYLNPVEEVWNVIKSKMDHSIRYADIKTHVAAFYEFVGGGGDILDCDFVKFWRRSPPKGITRPIIRTEGEPDASIEAHKVGHKT